MSWPAECISCTLQLAQPTHERMRFADRTASEPARGDDTSRASETDLTEATMKRLTASKLAQIGAAEGQSRTFIAGQFQHKQHRIDEQ